MKKKGVSTKKRFPFEGFSKRKSRRRRGEWPEGFSDAGRKVFSALNSWWENAPAQAAPIHSSISIFSYFLFFWEYQVHLKKKKIGDRILACNLWTSFLPGRVF